MDDHFVEYICDRPPAASRFFGPDLTGDDDGDQRPTSAGCHHGKATTPKRKYMLNFEKETDDCAESEAEEERRRCRNFWEFIDSEPALSSLIKEGQFLHENQPQKFVACSKTNCCIDGELPMDDPEMATTLDKIMESRAREREAFAARREKIRQLQLKSGQPIFVSKPCEKKKQGDLLAHMVNENLDEELASIQEYDEEKVKLKGSKKKKHHLHHHHHHHHHQQKPKPFETLLRENQTMKAEYFTKGGSGDRMQQVFSEEEEEEGEWEEEENVN